MTKAEQPETETQETARLRLTFFLHITMSSPDEVLLEKLKRSGTGQMLKHLLGKTKQAAAGVVEL